MNDGNRVDELRYLLLVSQVELVRDESALSVSQYFGDIQFEERDLKVAVINADGHKCDQAMRLCDRCWNYSTTVGTFSDEPLIYDRAMRLCDR
ncbi:hypothetical protein [Geminocystis sp. NIES-3709]|uniref:hypothetical protein n=1 Tax=Geminocystis sp. NIES-3709 TaxID=1617448 RepID=UPI0005FC9263|nr:hypothetical protein [Geminocystis sp. NIES-3709]BAQ64736.1 isoleucyl-tRNA synthetase [Geminocystis sp. NIES-3709]